MLNSENYSNAFQDAAPAMVLSHSMALGTVRH